LAVVYKFVVNLAEVNRQVGAKMEARNYLEKKEHWVVHD
jgi:hypothetical protein